MANGKKGAGTGLSQLSIKTRIETRQKWEAISGFFSLSQLSIKTRIETFSLPMIHKEHHRGLSQLSIKTRIETRKQPASYRNNWQFESAIH